MIDKLDLRLPADTQLRREVQAFVLEGEALHLFERSRPSKYYRSVTDLRPIGMDAMLHRSLQCKRDCAFDGSHKLEMIDVGSKGFSDWNQLLQRVTDDCVDSLSLMRIDTCADLFNVPVSRFYGRLRVKFKRSNRNIGDSKWQTIAADTIQTITAGKRPNFLRIYDKTAERNQQYRRARRRSAIDLPSFEETYGHAPDAVIARVERQHSARGVPSALRTFGDLHRAADYNPFSTMEITDAADPLDFSSMPGLSASQTLTAMGYACLREKLGADVTARWYNKRGGNHARFRETHPFLFQTHDGTELLQRIVTEYRDSTIRQLSL